jgi:hypothetical protein
MDLRPFLIWSGIRESNSLLILGKDAYYRCTNPALTLLIDIRTGESFHQCDINIIPLYALIDSAIRGFVATNTYGKTSTFPEKITFGSVRRFACAIEVHLYPSLYCFTAIDQRLSP